MTIWHLAEPRHWLTATQVGSYTESTRGRSLAQEGFIPLFVRRAVSRGPAGLLRGLPGSVLLLEVDEARLPEPPVHEVGNPGTGETFPHLYAALPVAAVVDVTELSPPHA